VQDDEIKSITSESFILDQDESTEDFSNNYFKKNFKFVELNNEILNIWYDKPKEIIIKKEHLDDSYLQSIIKEKKLTADQVTKLKTKIREYIGRLTTNEEVILSEESYKSLINLTIYLIEESSKE
jgi:hypothetical protein